MVFVKRKSQNQFVNCMRKDGLLTPSTVDVHLVSRFQKYQMEIKIQKTMQTLSVNSVISVTSPPAVTQKSMMAAEKATTLHIRKA